MGNKGSWVMTTNQSTQWKKATLSINEWHFKGRGKLVAAQGRLLWHYVGRHMSVLHADDDDDEKKTNVKISYSAV